MLYHETSDNSTAQLLPLVLLKRNETPLSFFESVQFAYQERLGEITKNLEQNLSIASEIYFKLSSPEKDYDLCLDEYLSIYFYSLELTPKELNIYTRLNQDLTSSNRDQTIPKWKYYLYYLISALSKIPLWTSQQDLYKGVRLNLVKSYPETYSVGKEIIWWGLTSTTPNLETLHQFLSEEPESTIFCINTSKSDLVLGRNIKSLSAGKEQPEEEIIFPPRCRFTILQIITEGRVNYIYLKQHD